jgi:hypothetical protein
MNEGGIPDGANAVRLTACFKAAGVKTKARSARINVDDISHGGLNIVAIQLETLRRNRTVAGNPGKVKTIEDGRDPRSLQSVA